MSCLVLLFFYLPNRKFRMGTTRCWTGHDDRTASSFCSLLPIFFYRKVWNWKWETFLNYKSQRISENCELVGLRILVSVGRGSWLLRALNLGTMMAKDVVNTFYTAPTLHWQNVLFINLCTFTCWFWCFFQILVCVIFCLFSPSWILLEKSSLLGFSCPVSLA